LLCGFSSSQLPQSLQNTASGHHPEVFNGIHSLKSISLVRFQYYRPSNSVFLLRYNDQNPVCIFCFKYVLYINPLEVTHKYPLKMFLSPSYFKVKYRIQISPPFFPTLTQMNPVHTLLSYFPKIQTNVIFLSFPRSSE